MIQGVWPRDSVIENQSESVSAAALTEYAETMRRLQERPDEPFVTMNTVTEDFGLKRRRMIMRGSFGIKLRKVGDNSEFICTLAA